MARILVVDDEKSIRNTLKDVLEYEKYEVDLAEEGATGIKMFSQETYDVVLCDIKMAKMDGIEVLQKIQEISADGACDNDLGTRQHRHGCGLDQEGCL